MSGVSGCHPLSDPLSAPGRREGSERSVTVEIYGNARLLSGRSEVRVTLPERACARDVAERLARAVPELVGEVVHPGGQLAPSYVLNLNGRRFMTESSAPIGESDRILLFSSQAGG